MQRGRGRQGVGWSLETRITRACVMIFPGGIMDGIGDELGTDRDVLFNGLMSTLIREIRRNPAV